MKLRIGKRYYRVFVYDLESHNDEESIKLNQTGVWLSAFIDENSKLEDDSNYYYDVESFLDRLEQETTQKRTRYNRPCNNILVYVFNLEHEWSFLLPVILKRGFVWDDTLKSDYSYRSTSTKSCSSVWSATLRFKNGPGFGLCEFRDLSKFYRGSLRRVAEEYGLETKKGEINYKINRRHNYTPTKEEKEYVFKDCRVCVDLLLKNINDKSFFKNLSLSSYSTQNMINKGFSKKRKPYKTFRKYFPELGEEETKMLRQGYEGGLCYVTPNFQYKTIKARIGHIDAHQMHPSSAYMFKYPYGKGIYFKGNNLPKDNYYQYLLRIKVSYTSKKLDCVIKLINVAFCDDYELVVWSFELPNMERCYDNFSYKIIDGYAYKVAFLPWRDYYKENYDKRHLAKLEQDVYMVQRYKDLNNMSYGKLNERQKDISYENYIDELGAINSIEHARTFKTEEKALNAKYTYLPVGTSVPAHSKVRLINMAFFIGWEYIIYMDTDSLFFLLNERTEEALKKINLNDELGGWGREADITEAEFSAPKRYKVIEDGKLSVKMAGVNFITDKEHKGMYETPEGTYKPFSLEGVDIDKGRFKTKGSKRAKGGRLIVDRVKALTIQEKYQDRYSNNAGKEVK